MATFHEQTAELQTFVNQMQATSSSLDKVEILKKQSRFIAKVLHYTYNPYKQYNVTSKTAEIDRIQELAKIEKTS